MPTKQMGVDPARAGMILGARHRLLANNGRPRASGDDPRIPDTTKGNLA